MKEDPWQPLRRHLEQHPKCAQLQRGERERLINWIRSSRPFENVAEFQSRLRKAKLKGLSRQQKLSVIQSLRHGIGRRPFLASISVASALSVGVGVQGLAASDEKMIPSSSFSLRPLLAAFQKQQLTIGRSVALFAGDRAPDSGSAVAARWRQFCHALDMSNWLEAAVWLGDQTFASHVHEFAGRTPAAGVTDALERVLVAWNYLLSTEAQWEEEYFVAYALGKMPALATADSSVAAIPDFDEMAFQCGSAIHEMAPLFHALEIFNQRFQQPGRTIDNAPVRVSQGHNYSFAHFAEDLLNPDLFPPDRDRVLVNWDAHADLSGPFDNPRMPMGAPFAALQAAANFAERVVVASSMSISGWILPLLYQGILSVSGHVSRVIWVVPKEAHQTSHNYMEPYGEYSFVVGDWRLPESKDEITRLSTLRIGDWTIPGATEIRKYGDSKTLRSIVERGLLENQRECKLHIVDPENLPQISQLVEGAAIALSVDADFAGTREPGLTPRRGFLPHYPLTGSPEKAARHEELLGQLATFVDEHKKQIHSVSIANSPNFTVSEASRKPVAKILSIVTGEDLAGQPKWIAGEIARAPPTEAHSGPGSANSALTLGGISGLLFAAAMLMRDRGRMREIHRLLFCDGYPEP